MLFEIVIQVLFLFILPTMLLRYYPLSHKHRFAVFLVIPLILTGIVLWEHWSFADVGFRTDTLLSASVAYGMFTLMGILGIIFYSNNLQRTPRREWWKHWHFQIGFLLLAFLQQFTFQGFLVHQFQLLGLSSVLIVIITTVLYIFIHSIYRDFAAGLPLLIIAGVMFAWLYLVYPNILIATLSHSILNFTAVLYGFFSEPYNHRK